MGDENSAAVPGVDGPRVKRKNEQGGEGERSHDASRRDAGDATGAPRARGVVSVVSEPPPSLFGRHEKKFVPRGRVSDGVGFAPPRRTNSTRSTNGGSYGQRVCKNSLTWIQEISWIGPSLADVLLSVSRGCRFVRHTIPRAPRNARVMSALLGVSIPLGTVRKFSARVSRSRVRRVVRSAASSSTTTALPLPRSPTRSPGRAPPSSPLASALCRTRTKRSTARSW